jgi:tripartite-type tricarboxylate transporter receptor subunit TctC
MNPVPLHHLPSSRARRRKLLAAQGLELPSMKPDELAAFGRTEIFKWSELVKRSGAQID